MMQVKNKLTATTYQKLIEYASTKCDAVMFVTKPWHYENGRSPEQEHKLRSTIDYFEEQLRGDFLKKRTNDQWVVNMERSGIPALSDDGFGVYFYNFSDKTKEYLLYNRDLYEWLNPDYPEDLAFFEDGYCWLYSVAHEQLCFIYCDDEQEYEYLKSIGIEFYEEDFMHTPKDCRYFEAYGSIKKTKNALMMSNDEFRNNKHLLTENDKIARKTETLKNTCYFPGKTTYYRDSITLLPDKLYNFRVTLLSQPTKRMGVALEVPYGEGGIMIDSKDTKKHIFWFPESIKQYNFTARTSYGKITAYYTYKEDTSYYDDEFDHNKIAHEVDGRMYNAKAIKYIEQHTRYREEIRTYDDTEWMFMDIEEIAHNKRIYRRLSPYKDDPDFKEFIFSIEWTPARNQKSLV